MIGAAQCRHHDATSGHDAILQHGSLLLSLDERWSEIAGGPMESATSLSDIKGGANLNAERVIEALAAGFAEVAGGVWVASPLSKEETELSHHLQEEKYRRDSWTFGAKSEQDIFSTR